MNIAFSAVLALTLVLPGLIWLRVRRSGDRPQFPPPVPQPLSLDAVMVILAAGIIHALWYGIAKLFLLLPFAPHVDIRLDAVVMLLMGKYGPNDCDLEYVIGAASSHPFCILSYFSGLYVVSALLAVCVGPLVDRILEVSELIKGPDSRAKEWRKFFEGGEGRMALITAVVDMGGDAYLFLGVLKQLFFNQQTGELERLELEDVCKKLLKHDTGADGDGDFKTIFGDLFVLRYSEVKTLNVIYVREEAAAE